MSLIEIKNQIKSTKNTRKITKAMQLVAASKMKRFQKVAESSKAYSRGLLDTLSLTHRSIADTSFGSANEGADKELFVLLTSDKGLCGAMNAKLIRTLFKGDAWNDLADDKRTLITVGRKSTESARAQGRPADKSFTGTPEQMQPMDAIEIVDDILEYWDSGAYKKVHLISPWYVNAFTFHAKQNTFLPLTEEVLNQQLQDPETGEMWVREYEADAAYFEPDRDTVAAELALQIVQSLFIESFYQLKATEYSSRMVAMKKATEAADDQIKLLTAKFNKARQAAITRQLAELAAASDAMSSQNTYEVFEV